ncbi:hypothetical protein JW933_07515 [candidate division FCPU426 bacterium]|nr:hypothetical protein [candidate division FCPU426 bacterium]
MKKETDKSDKKTESEPMKSEGGKSLKKSSAKGEKNAPAKKTGSPHLEGEKKGDNASESTAAPEKKPSAGGRKIQFALFRREEEKNQTAAFHDDFHSLNADPAAQDAKDLDNAPETPINQELSSTDTIFSRADDMAGQNHDSFAEADAAARKVDSADASIPASVEQEGSQRPEKVIVQESRPMAESPAISPQIPVTSGQTEAAAESGMAPKSMPSPVPVTESAERTSMPANDIDDTAADGRQHDDPGDVADASLPADASPAGKTLPPQPAQDPLRQTVAGISSLESHPVRKADTAPPTKSADKNPAGQPVDQTAKQARPGWMKGLVLVLAGLAGMLGGGVGYHYLSNVDEYRRQMMNLQNTVKKLSSEKKQLGLQLEESTLKLNSLQLGLHQMNKVFDSTAEPPGKPQYERIGDGVLVYWLDGVFWRRYYLYQASGKKGAFHKVNKRAIRKNFIYLKELKPGLWRYTVTALDREGKETIQSEELAMNIRP